MLLVMIAAQASAEEALPPGFLEYLGAMVEVQGATEAELLDPLAFENLLEPDEPLPDGERGVPADAETALPPSRPFEEVTP